MNKRSAHATKPRRRARLAAQLAQHACRAGTCAQQHVRALVRARRGLAARLRVPPHAAEPVSRCLRRKQTKACGVGSGGLCSRGGAQTGNVCVAARRCGELAKAALRSRQSATKPARGCGRLVCGAARNRGAGPHASPRRSSCGACRFRHACRLCCRLARCADGAERLSYEGRAQRHWRSDRDERSRAGVAGLQGSGYACRAGAPSCASRRTYSLAAPAQGYRRLRPRLRSFWPPAVRS